MEYTLCTDRADSGDFQKVAVGGFIDFDWSVNRARVNVTVQGQIN